MTTPDPGDKLVLMYDLTLSPRSTAFFANSPAPSITDGLLVFVQLVMAAITTEPKEITNKDRGEIKNCIINPELQFSLKLDLPTPMAFIQNR